MVNQATGADRSDAGKQVIVSGYAGVGVVTRVLGRTVEVEMPYGKLSVDQDKIFLVEKET